MSNTFNKDKSFEAKQLGFINIIVGVFFSVCTLFVLFYFRLGFITILAILSLTAGAAASFKRGKSKKVSFKINTSGIFYFDKCITNWSNYKRSYFKREIGGISGLSEETFLSIEYYKDGASGFFIKKIKLGNEDKDENDIIDAIEFYYNASME
jgi:hypothetical protein